jgi:hypothetical protein
MIRRREYRVATTASQSIVDEDLDALEVTYRLNVPNNVALLYLAYITLRVKFPLCESNEIVRCTTCMDPALERTPDFQSSQA